MSVLVAPAIHAEIQPRAADRGEEHGGLTTEHPQISPFAAAEITI